MLKEINKIGNKCLYEDEFGRTFSVEVDDRQIVLHLPKNYDQLQKYKLLLFFMD
jgi:enterochelin esterase-like enzyme